MKGQRDRRFKETFKSEDENKLQKELMKTQEYKKRKIMY